MIPAPRGTIEIAYERLGVTAEQVHTCVQITPQLKAIAAIIRRAGQPKVKKTLESAGEIKVETEHQPPYGPGSDIAKSWPWYLEVSDSPDARKVLAIYYSCFKIHRKVLPIEAFCIAASVSPLRILECLTATCVRLGAQASSIIAAVNHPRVVEKTVEMALTDEGHEDRADLHKAVGFLPTAKGGGVVVNVKAEANAQAQAAAVPAPPAEQTIRRLVNRFNDQRQLPADTGSVRLPEVMPHESLEPVEVVGRNVSDEEEEEAELPD